MSFSNVLITKKADYILKTETKYNDTTGCYHISTWKYTFVDSTWTKDNDEIKCPKKIKNAQSFIKY